MNATALKPIKALNPKSTDLKYTGQEPVWDATATLDESQRRIRLISAFTWYNYHYDKKQAKECVIDWLARSTEFTDLAKPFGRVADSAVPSQLGWLCRINLRGLELNERESSFVKETISTLVNTVKNTQEKKEPEDAAPRVTIQDRLRERMMEAAGEIEGMYDDLVRAGARMSADYKPMAVLRGINVAPQLVGEIAKIWQGRLDELEVVVAGRDAQLAEGYGNFGKIQLRNLIKFAEQVIADCASYQQVKKVERKPRAKKPVSPEKLTARFKYLKAFDELKLVSESVTRLVNSTEAWLYDTKKRKLIHVVADSHVGSMSVKGSALIGFDATNSTQKTLRRPAEQLKTVMSASAAAARKFFRDIKATEVKFNGRGNENLIILKAR